MPKIHSPLFSYSAQGTFAKRLNFTTYKKMPFVRSAKQKKVPFDPKTSEQVFNRYYFSVIIIFWHNLSADEKKQLDKLSKKLKISGFNYYVKQYYIERPADIGNIVLGYSLLG